MAHANLPNLEELSLSDTPVSDISALANLTKLTHLYLWRAPVSDISALANLPNLRVLTLDGCPLSAASVQTHIPALRKKGVRVSFDKNVTPAVRFPDVNLANVINSVLDRRVGDQITPEMMHQIRSLSVTTSGIADLTGLEHAINLEVLSVSGTAVSDISVLANLMGLKVLYLEDTNVSDISALANLTDLQVLYLEDTNVSDISALANLTNLWLLDLTATNVSDISPLANLTNLKTLKLGGTKVSDFSPLANLTNLWLLNLAGTKFTDFSPLANLPNLEKLDLGDTKVSDISPLVNFPKLKTLELHNTTLSADSHTHFFAMEKKGIDFWGWSSIYVDVEANLAKRIRKYLKLSEGTPLELFRLERMLGLRIRGDDNVSDISALGYCRNLERLSVSGTNVSDISALANLTKLEMLDLRWTNVSDISALANLTKLKELYLQGDLETGSKVSNFSALAKLTKLETLDLGSTSISDISALEKFTKLKVLSLAFTNVRDISPLANLRNLEELNLLGTQLNADSYGYIRVMEEAGITVTAEPSPVRTIDGLWIAPGKDLPDKGGNRFIILTQYGNNCGPTSLEMVLHYYAKTRTIEAIRDAGDIHEVWVGTWPGEMEQALNELGVPAHWYDEDTGNFKDDPFSYLRYFVRENQPSCILLRYRNSAGNIRYHWVVVVGYHTETNEYLLADPAKDKKGGAFRWVSRSKLDKWWGFKSLDKGDVSYWDEVWDEELLKFVAPIVAGGFDPFGFATNFAAGPYTVIRPTSAPTIRVKNLRTEYGWNGVTGDGNGPKGFHRVKGKAELGGSERDWSETIYFNKPFDFYTVSAIKVDWAKFNFGGTATLTGHKKIGNAVKIWGRVSDGLIVRGVLDVLVRPYYDVDAVSSAIIGAPAQLALPAETSLLPNYPNPFNPETWIPYQLSEAAAVTVSIYSLDGKRVRTLELGQVPAGVYSDRGRAAYWDGRNAQGEPVASGVYFYTLQAGDFKATRKMVIRK